MTEHFTRFLSIVLLSVAALLSTAPFASAGGVGGRGRAASATIPALTGAWAAQSSGTRQALFAVACLDARRCTAVGAAGTIVFTKNGGSTWRPQRNPLVGSSTTLYRSACVGSSTCYVIGRPNIVLVTHNGGLTWSVHRFALPGLGPSSLTQRA